MFSNGILLLAAAAVALIIGFDANLDRLIQLYIIGVFTSFTLSQFGMVRHWQRALRDRHRRTGDVRGRRERRAIRRSQAINAAGAVFTAVVLVVVFATKVAHGAWIAVIAMIVLFVAMRGTNRYYRRVTAEVSPDPDDRPSPCPAGSTPSCWSPGCTSPRCGRWPWPAPPGRTPDRAHPQRRRRRHPPAAPGMGAPRIPVPLTVLEAPYRDLTRPLLNYVKQLRATNPGQ